MNSPTDADQIDEIAQQEAGAEQTREFRIFGPPGTGKTTNISRQIARAVDRYGPQSVLVTSFSRAAAAELAGRDLPISSDRVGTLHSHCWRAIGDPELAEANVEEWNRGNPRCRLRYSAPKSVARSTTRHTATPPGLFRRIPRCHADTIRGR